MREKSIEEHRYTSTGAKFWMHPEQMQSYREGSGNTIISTHISPTGKCNLNCSYCSVKQRARSYEIEPEIIMDYVDKLITRGLKAMIFTGGGEPTLYPHFNNVARYVREKGLETALITNGTLADKVDTDVWKNFSWVRVSINQFPNWQERISLTRDRLGSETVFGSSFVYTGQGLDQLRQVSGLAKRLGVEYVRVLPDCLPGQEELLKMHKEVDQRLEELGDKTFFHQFKIHGSPDDPFCHQSFFRPYLSEVEGGTVFPCDSVVLNEKQEHFNERYGICKAGEILDFLDGKIKAKFDPREDCTGCVFTENVNMLGRWKNEGTIPDNLKEDKKMTKHKNFP
jgi:MoaA/NifB/PqqE/SkfB family radical SAM enzyme